MTPFPPTIANKSRAGECKAATLLGTAAGSDPNHRTVSAPCLVPMDLGVVLEWPGPGACGQHNVALAGALAVSHAGGIPARHDPWATGQTEQAAMMTRDGQCRALNT